MPGLLRGMARTAVVAGTATAVSNRVSRRQGERWAAQEPHPSRSRATPPRRPRRPRSRLAEDRVAKLKDLADLREQGVLTDEEFAAEKARILGS